MYINIGYTVTFVFTTFTSRGKTNMYKCFKKSFLNDIFINIYLEKLNQSLFGY